jgi:hypothetical protein
MARPVEQVSRQVRRALIRDAGDKCANPGCASARTHIHHIEYKVYSTNDEKTLIAICPTCHDAVHNGALAIDDGTIYRWKQLRRQGGRGHIYVEPGGQLKLLLGTIAVTGPSGVRAFDLSPNQRLSFSIHDGDIMLIDLEIASHQGEPVVRLTRGHVRVLSPHVSFQQRPGRIQITAPLVEEYLPAWALDRLRVQEPAYGADNRITLLEIEVLEPGLVKAKGVWADGDRVVVITDERLAFIWPELREPVSIAGAGPDSVFMNVGPISSAVFGFGQDAPAALIVDQARRRA